MKILLSTQTVPSENENNYTAPFYDSEAMSQTLESRPVSGSTIAPAPLIVDHTAPEWRCNICQAPCTQQCSLCKEVGYCGKTHQRDDWPSHKLACVGNAPLGDGKCKIVYDYDSKGTRRGRKLIVNNKPIQAGELLIKEQPLVWVPKYDIIPHDSSSSNTETGKSTCIICGKLILTGESSVGWSACSTCHWPVCSEECERNPVHERECKVFQTNLIPSQIHQVVPNRFLFVLRCLLLPTSDPKKWRQLMELEYNPEEMTKKYSPTDMFADMEEDVIDKNKKESDNSKSDKAITKLLKYYGVKCELEWVAHLTKVIRWNMKLDHDGDSRAMLLYMGSAAQHSCLPNAEIVFRSSDGFAYIRALVDIKPGDPVFISRDPQALMLTAQVRQPRLKHITGWEHFRCNCSRCADWTELGTNFASLQCRKKLENWGNQAVVTEPSPCAGILAATRPLDQNFEWKCPICKLQVAGDLTADKLGMKNLISQVFHFADADASYIDDGIQTVESFQYWFHPNHSFMFQTKIRILDTVTLLFIQAATADGETAYKFKTTETFELKEFNTLPTVRKLLHYGVDCLKTANSIFPGYSRIRGHILLFLGIAKFTLYKLLKKQEAYEGEVDFVQYSEAHLLLESVDHMKEAIKILYLFKNVREDESRMVKFAFNYRLGVLQHLKQEKSK